MSAFNFNDDEKALADGIAALLNQIPVVPDNIVEAIDGAEYAEDGETFIITATTRDGKHLFVSVCPGEPVRVSVSP
jgi:hypothetical protein